MNLDVILPIAILSVCGGLLVAGPVVAQALASRRLRRQGRTCALSDALSRVRAGHGCIILNKSNVDGRLWWTPEDPWDVCLDSLDRPETLLTDSYAPFWWVRPRVPDGRLVTLEGIVRTGTTRRTGDP